MAFRLDPEDMPVEKTAKFRLDAVDMPVDKPDLSLAPQPAPATSTGTGWLDMLAREGSTALGGMVSKYPTGIDAMQEINHIMREIQTPAQNLAAGAINLVPYLIPYAGQAKFGADIARNPEMIPEMIERSGQAYKDVGAATGTLKPGLDAVSKLQELIGQPNVWAALPDEVKQKLMVEAKQGANKRLRTEPFETLMGIAGPPLAGMGAVGAAGKYLPKAKRYLRGRSMEKGKFTIPPAERPTEMPVETPTVAPAEFKPTEAPKILPTEKVGQKKPLIEEAKSQTATSKPTPKAPKVETPKMEKKAGKETQGLGQRTAGEIPKSMEDISGKAIGPVDIHKYFKKSLDLPIRTGHFAPSQSRFWAGFYKTKPEVVRLKDYKAIGTLTHEVAHHIDKKFNIKKERLRSRELGKLDYDYPKKSRTSEGFAEYIRTWMTQADDAGRLAPKFTEKFESFLKNEPELKQILDNGKMMITRWREQGAVKRVYSQIDISGKSARPTLFERVKQGYYKGKELFIDDLAQLDYAERQIRGVKNLEVEARKGRLRPSESPTMVARADAKKANSKAKSMILDGTFDYSGKKTGISLREALTPVSRDMENWLTYAYSKRAVDLYNRGINPGIELADAKYVVQKFESPKFKKSLKDVTDYQDRVLEYLKDAGGLSDDAMQTIRDMNPMYIPLKRVFESDAGAFLQGKKLADVANPIKRIKGSGRQIKNPLYSIVENTSQIIQTADKIRVGKALIELAEKTEGVGKWVEKVPTPKQFHKVSLEMLEKQLRESGVNLSEADLGQVINFFSNAPKYLGKDNIVSFWRKGKKEFYEVDPALYRSLSAMDTIQLKGYMRILGAPARAVRLGATGLRAGFSLITNPIRDAFGFAMQTEFSRGTPELIGRGLYRKLRPGDPMHQLFKRSGSDFSQYLGIDRRQLKNAVHEVLASDAKRKTLNVLRHPIEATKALLSVTEAGPRIAEFEKAYKKGGELYGQESVDARIMASIAASDVTVNFGRMGTVISSVNQLIPFFNAGIQGVSRFNRYMLEHPVKGGLKGAAIITTPTVILWNINKDEQWYKELPAWQKYGFWNIKVGDNKDGSPLILRIPKPFEWGIAFGSAPEAALNYFYNKNPEELKEAIGQMIEYVNPIDLPTVIKIPIEVWANYDFFRERDIDPFFEVKYKEPEDRYSPYTTETAKKIGKTFGLSPRMIEHVIGTSTGGLGMDIVRTGEGVGMPSTIKTPADYPVVGRLFGRSQPPIERKERLKYLKQQEITEIKKLRKAGKLEEAKNKIKYWNNKYPDFKIGR